MVRDTDHTQVDGARRSHQVVLRCGKAHRSSARRQRKTLPAHPEAACMPRPQRWRIFGDFRACAARSAAIAKRSAASPRRAFGTVPRPRRKRRGNRRSVTGFRRILALGSGCVAVCPRHGATPTAEVSRTDIERRKGIADTLFTPPAHSFPSPPALESVFRARVACRSRTSHGSHIDNIMGDSYEGQAAINAGHAG